ncbi:catalase [Sphingomonas koreensis]|nr:catalase [Sphingomonas koreensis]
MVPLLCAALAPVRAETVTPVFQHQLENAAGKSFTVVEVDFAPGAKADPHRHGQAFVFAYVLSGSVRSQLAGEPVRTYRAGESWFEPPGAHHVLTENISATDPARLLVTFVAATGQPLKISDHAEGNPTMLQHASPSARIPARQVALAADAAAPPPQKMVDALYSAFGDNHSRAVHAKGIMAVGTFQPSPLAKGLSKAPLFAGGTLPILVRFSNFTGIPTIPDTIGDANPRGLAIKFQLADGTSADVIAHSFNGFPTATSAEFRQLLLAIGSSGAGATKPTALDGFLAAHPIAKTFLTTQKPLPESYATLSYFGVNAFSFSDARGHQRFVRYRFVPTDGEAFLSKEAVPAAGPDYLQTELPRRLAKAPIEFIWYAQIGEASDAIGDPSIAWPETRQLVKLGTIRIDRMVLDPVKTDKGTLFLPLNVPPGIDPADPTLGIRQGAYPLSFDHRQ